MTVGSFQRRNDVMWPSDATEIRRAEETDHPRRATTEPPLPFYVQPALGEALIGVPLISVPKVPVLRTRKRGKKCRVDQ